MPDVLEFWIEADAFMRHMNRVLVGTMLEVAGGRRSPRVVRGAADGAAAVGGGADGAGRTGCTWPGLGMAGSGCWRTSGR